MEQDIISLAIEAITQEIEKNPQDAYLYKERGRLRRMNGDEKGAMEDLREAVRLDPDILGKIDGKFNIK